MVYESLLLNAGGGIIPARARVQIPSNTAAVCIGIGGLGIDALCNLRGKIYEQLMPDNPGDPVPRYERIQLLGIDSDNFSHRQYHGNNHLSEYEFFSIWKDNLHTIFTHPRFIDLIKSKPTLSWMEIDKITPLLTPEGAGGIRQIGRYLLMEKAMELYHTICHKCQTALHHVHAGYAPLDIHIFAGLSGGTGGGCFLDVCYLIRQIAESHGLNIRIIGYFFLPDVVTSKIEVSSQKTSVDYNNRNGYAALKELDYLMHLNTSNGWFTQDYCNELRVHTQQAPLDMCHLISATAVDGSITENGYHSSVDLASEAVMAELTGSMPSPAPVHADAPYHCLGIATAEIPTREIFTYLTTGFFQKFRMVACKPEATITNDDITALMEKLGLRANRVQTALVSNSPTLNLPHYDNPREVAQMCPIPKGKAPERWSSAGNEWLSICEDTMHRNLEALTRDLEDYNMATINNQSLIERLFQELLHLSMDPQYGPYYAAALLKSNRHEDLLFALEGEIRFAESRRQHLLGQFYNIEEHQEYCSVELAQRNLFSRKKVYLDYHHASENLYLTHNAVMQCTMTSEALRKFRYQVEVLYNNFFRPLCYLLDNLMDTFQENEDYLRSTNHSCTLVNHLVTLNELRPRLDTLIDQLSPQQIVNGFLQNLLRNSHVWLKGNEQEISQLINRHMIDLFRSEGVRTMTDYLFEVCPHIPPGNVHQLADMLKHNTLPALHDRAKPLFWCDPIFAFLKPVESSNLSVPQSCPAACMAANQFTAHVCQTELDELRILRQWSGVPLAAYKGLQLMKAAYDTPAYSAGLHLYPDTGRGNNMNWRETLPELISEP